ncbi:LOW QUALITY PROTEIN: hypothetical protein OSB04_000848 [Centaurea solstitialis]|uniref:CCHC-type domain-containing protein n=1 Tax=Centaurea solstitialis TaxID=347529 RepID=A0AA38U881_9ASTR|nr:LOW QUALITY PROTEIN: hypothetical protein OSB04_000848 [Centaurea solstitialis]
MIPWQGWLKGKNHGEDESLCRGYILNSLTDRLYDLYIPLKSTKEIWKALDHKYDIEKQGANKLIAFKFFVFCMIDNLSILDQVHEFLILISKFKNLNITIPDQSEQELSHTKEDFTLEPIQKHLQIQEEARKRKKDLNVASTSKVHNVTQRNPKNKKRKTTYDTNTSTFNKKRKRDMSEIICHKCGRKGHIRCSRCFPKKEQIWIKDE